VGGASSAADEALVIEIWSGVLGKQIGRDDNFFEVGGHSLLAVKVFRQLSERSNGPLALTDIFRYPNARKLGAHIAAHRAADDGSAAGAADASPRAGGPGPRTPGPTASDDRGARRRNALLGKGRGTD
jgi:hypothetical protein